MSHEVPGRYDGKGVELSVYSRREEALEAVGLRE